MKLAPLDTQVFEETDKNKRSDSSETVRNSEDNSDKQKDGEAIGRHGLGLDSIRGLGSSSQRRIHQQMFLIPTHVVDIV